MKLNNIVLGWRNIRKNGIFSVINIVGLALGVAVVVLILFWVVDELNFDKFHTKLDRIYTVYEHQQYSEGHELFTACTPFPLSQTLVQKYPEVENATTYTNMQKMLIKAGDKEYKEGPVYLSDPHFLDVFTFPLLEGNKNALSSPDQIIITDDLAHLFFGDESALGKVLKINGDNPLTVGAVVKTQKANSTLKFKVLVPIKVAESFGADLSRWGNNWPRTSILLAKSENASKLNGEITNLCKDNGQPNTTLHLFPFKKEHLYSYSGKNNRIQYIYQFLAIAVIIILIASINFINLSIAKAEQRRPEVGVRKVMGANKMNIMKQFLIEKGIMIFLSLILSAILVIVFFPAFKYISDKQMLLANLQNKYMILFLGAAILLVLVVSVIYPSMYLSSFNPVLAMKKTLNSKRRGFSLKSLLVVFQFMLAVILICGSITISQQLKYINNYDLGYNRANLVYLPLDGETRSKHEAIKQEISRIPGVMNITQSNKVPFYGGNSSWGYDWEGKDPENKVLICRMDVDNNYFKTLGIKMVEGTGFPKDYDKVVNLRDLSTPKVVLNQEAIRRMGMKDPVGKYFTLFGDQKAIITGVTEDFHFESLRHDVEPMLLLPLTENPSFLIIRINPTGFAQTINKIKASWAAIVPQTTCEVGFFDDKLADMYHSEMKISSLFKYFSFIAIFISCIGLFGLSMFVIGRRNKEIGVRKVNGAKIGEVMVLLNRDFVRWVIIAFVIALPIAYYAMNRWLENFAYKTALSWWIFAMAGILALGVAILTVSWQSWRAATRNPVEALRYE